MEKVANLLSRKIERLTGSSATNTTNGSSLHQAPNATVVEKLLLEREDHNALDSSGDAPLHCYVKRRDKERYDCLIMFLIHSKCDVNLRNSDGQTALHLACKGNDVDVAKALISFDAKINAVNIDDQTPLDLVARGSELEELLALLGALRYQELLHSTSGHGQPGDAGIDTFLDETDDGFSTPPESATELASIRDQEERISEKEKSMLGNGFDEGKVTASAEDPSIIGVSLMVAGGLAASHQLEEEEERQGNGSKATASPDDSQPGQCTHFNVQKRKSRKDIGIRRRNIFIRKNSEAAFKSVSGFNPEMEVMDSIIGHSVAKALTPALEQKHHQRVLCLDGGGMKGLVQIEMLKMIEQMTGKSITELFDWMVGTSTGAIVALGMVYGERSLESLRSTYFGMKDNVFQPQFKPIGLISDTKALEKTIKDMFGTERRMGDVKKSKVVVTAVDKSTTDMPLVFFNNCFEDKNFNNELVWKVARYTTAAPVYFSECDNYVDGGVKANDPSAFALTEIQSFLSRCGPSAPKISCVVSLGCGVYPSAPLGNTDIAEALKDYKPKLIASRVKELLTMLVSTIGASEGISKHCKAICEQQGIAYFRFNPQMTEAIELTERDSRKLCDIIIKAKQLFRENAQQVEKMIEHLGCKISEDYLRHL